MPARAASAHAERTDRIGPYRVVAMLGEGGMGVVYRARHQDSGELVALKVVRMPDENLLASFRREIFALRSIAHPCVARIVADGVTEGHPWYAMALIEGRTLADHIDELHAEPAEASVGAPFARAAHADDVTVQADSVDESERTSGVVATGPAELDALARAPTVAPPPQSLRRMVPRLADTLTLMHAVCEPLAYVHGKGLVHRDLKPDNVVIREDGVAVLVDFGLALMFGGGLGREVLDVAGRALGTPPYMAPEQIRGDLVDARADLYAFGCMLYECLTGFTPFYGAAAAVMNQALREMPPPPSAHVDGISPELDELVLRLLAKRAHLRLGYAADVARTLRDLGARTVPIESAPEPRPYLYRPGLAGRAGVTRALEPAIAGGRNRRGSLVLVSGQSGVGKTRLAMELATTAARRGMKVITGQCLEVRASTEGMSVRAAALHPFRPLLLAIADRCRSSGIDETARLVGDRAGVLAPYEPSFAHLPGAPATPPPELPAEAARARLLDSLALTVARFTEVQPLFLVLDDLQWADEVSLAFLAHLDAEYLTANDALVVATYRSEEVSDALREVADAPHVHAVELSALDRAAMASMVSDMLALAAPPQPLIDFLADESEGNPFFIAEYLKVAIGERILQRSDSGVWTIGRAGVSADSLRAALPLPGGLRDLVRRRVDRLGSSARRLAEMAAVLGREVDADVLLPAAPEVASPEALEELRALSILEETGGGALRFVHDKLREVLYDDIPSQQRGALHLAAARAIEQRHLGAADEALMYPILAHQWDAAGERDKTLEYLEKAGEHALATAASGEARRFFTRALELADAQAVDPLRVDPLRRAGWERRLGEACYNLGDLPAAKEQMLAALRRLEGEGASEVQAVATALAGQLLRLLRAGPRSERPTERQRYREAALAAERLSQIYFFMNQPNRAFAAALKTAHHAERLGPSPELARGYAVLSVGFGYVPLHALVESYGRRAQRVAEAVNDPAATAFVMFLRGLSALSEGSHAQARGYLRHAQRIARENRDVRASHEITGVLGHAITMGGDRQSALDLYTDLVDATRRAHNQQGVLWSAAGRACALTFMGRGAEACSVFRQHLPLLEQLADRTQHISFGMRAFAEMMEGRWEEAREIADATLELSLRERPAGYHVYFGYMGSCEVYLADLERAPNDAARARSACEVFERYARVFRLGRPNALFYRGLFNWLTGRRRAALRSWRKSLSLARHLAMPYEEGRACYELGRHLPLGNAERAQLLERAALLFDSTRSAYWSERLTTLR